MLMLVLKKEHDGEEWPLRSEPEQWHFIRLLCKTQTVNKEHFKHKAVHKCPWYQSTLGQRATVDFVIVSSDLRPYVLGTLVKRWSEMSPVGVELCSMHSMPAWLFDNFCLLACVA